MALPDPLASVNLGSYPKRDSSAKDTVHTIKLELVQGVTHSSPEESVLLGHLNSFKRSKKKKKEKIKTQQGR